MGRYRKVSVCIWNDTKINSLSDDAQLLFLFILTHPHMTGLGAMRATVYGLAAERKWKPERLSKAFEEICRKGIIEYDKSSLCLILPNFFKHNPPESPNVIVGWKSVIELIPESPLRYRQLENAGRFISTLSEPFQKAFERLSEVLPKGMANQEQEQEQEQDKDEGPDGPLSEPPVPPCPIQKIIELYHQTLPELSKVRSAKTIEKNLRSRWREEPRRQNLEWWSEFFNFVKESDFLMGKKNDFQAALGWLVGPKNFEKVLNGHYVNRNGGPARTRGNMAAAEGARKLLFGDGSEQK